MKFKKLLVVAGLLISTHSFAMERQEAMNWCWAASVQDVVLGTGRYVPQYQIAARLTGVPIDQPASINQVVQLVQSFGIRASGAGRPANLQELYDVLNSGRKLIAFVNPRGLQVGHFVVLEGTHYSGAIIVSDPATGQTFLNSPQQLYYEWQWMDSVVVG